MHVRGGERTHRFGKTDNIRCESVLRLTCDIPAAYASHSVLSTFFHWRQSTIYDIILQQQLDKWGISDSQVPLYKKLIVPTIQARLQKRIGDNFSIYANFRPAGNGTANWGKYQYTPGQVRDPSPLPRLANLPEPCPITHPLPRNPHCSPAITCTHQAHAFLPVHPRSPCCPAPAPWRPALQTSARYPQLAYTTANYLSAADVDEVTKEFKRFQLDDPEYARQLQQVSAAAAMWGACRACMVGRAPCVREDEGKETRRPCMRCFCWSRP